MANSLFSISLIILLSFLPITIQSHPPINSSHSLDLLIRDYTFKSYDLHLRTGTVQTVQLPSNFSGIKVDSARFRCGSLRRYGGQVKEFHLGIGVIIQPCVERVMVIGQNLGLNWSNSIYSSNYDLKGYKLVSPILGLLAYNAGTDKTVNLNPFELQIIAGEKPITIDFKNLTSNSNSEGSRPICASFERNGKVTFKEQKSLVCVTKRNGHYGLVVKLPGRMFPPPTVKRKISLWKMVVGCTVGSGLGISLLGLLMVAMLVKVKKKAKMEEMERRAYEEEALQVSMVGHVRAPTATVARTLPTIEHEYIPSYYPY